MVPHEESLSKVLRLYKGEDEEIDQWVLKANGRIAPRRALRTLQLAEMNSSLLTEENR